MTGRHSGVIRQIQDRAPEAVWTHCFLHRENLACKKMSPAQHRNKVVVLPSRAEGDHSQTRMKNDDNIKNVEAYAKLIQFLDDKSFSPVMREATNNG